MYILSSLTILMHLEYPQLTRLNLEMQKNEAELRDELSTCVTKAASDMDKRRIMELEKNEASIRLENDKLKVGGWAVALVKTKQKSILRESDQIKRHCLSL